MVWGCFCSDTLGPYFPIVNTMNSVSYIENVLEPFYSTFYLDLLNKQPDILFQQDNAPPHVSGKTRMWLSQRNVKLLTWPAQSPDISPIENIWYVIQM